MSRWLGHIVFMAVVLSLTGSIALANGDKDGSLSCRDNRDSWYGDRLVGHCEIKEQTVPAGGIISVDARKNGGVSIKGWDRNEVLVRARIQTAAASQNDADELAKQVKIETAGGRIFAEGPESRKDFHWDVSYEIFRTTSFRSFATSL